MPFVLTFSLPWHCITGIYFSGVCEPRLPSGNVFIKPITKVLWYCNCFCGWALMSVLTGVSFSHSVSLLLLLIIVISSIIIITFFLVRFLFYSTNRSWHAVQNTSFDGCTQELVLFFHQRFHLHPIRFSFPFLVFYCKYQWDCVSHTVLKGIECLIFISQEFFWSSWLLV